MHPIIFYAIVLAGGALSTLLANTLEGKVLAFVTFMVVTGLFVSSWRAGGADRRRALGFVLAAVVLPLTIWGAVSLLM